MSRTFIFLRRGNNSLRFFFVTRCMWEKAGMLRADTARKPFRVSHVFSIMVQRKYASLGETCHEHIAGKEVIAMKYYLSALLCLLFTLCIATTLYAAEDREMQSRDFQLLPASNALQISGAVQSVNRDAGTITVAKKFKDKTLTVTALADQETQIMKGDQKKDLSDIVTGDKVVVVYIVKGERTLAKSILLQ